MIYNTIAPFYDFLMNHVKYSEWINLIEYITKRFSLAKQTKILEIGGGTGNIGIQLKKIGYTYFISDISYKMSIQAKKKNLCPFCADACFLPVKRKFDLIIFLYDGINYLQTLLEYKKIFFSVSSCLNPNGLFLFDIITETNSYKYFFNFLDYQEFDGSSIIRHSYFKKNKSIQINNFIIFSPEPCSKKYFIKKTEHHSQKIFKPEQIKNVIPHNIFTCIGIFDGFSLEKYNMNSERIHFLLRKVI